jgi:hypothetical protein
MKEKEGLLFPRKAADSDPKGVASCDRYFVEIFVSVLLHELLPDGQISETIFTGKERDAPPFFHACRAY